MTLSPDEFAIGWGTDDLVRMVDSASTGAITDDARRFSIGAGLPALIRYSAGSNIAKITFCRLAEGPTSILDEKITGGTIPAEWSIY